MVALKKTGRFRDAISKFEQEEASLSSTALFYITRQINIAQNHMQPMGMYVRASVPAV